ncbi:MAG: D-alanyl-D-alanine carboxypeptidase/D-alanyl-D-alanine endopeptidase, partial [Bacteroidales bacterium]
GKGDPTIDSRYFKRADSFVGYIASSLRSKGIHKITGNIILNNSLYGTEVCAPKWSWDDMGNYYAAGIWGLNFKDNLYELTLKSGEKGQTPQIVSVVPDVPNMTFSMQLKAASNTKDSAYIYGAPFQSQRFVYGSIPANRSSFTIKGDMYDPNVVLISELKKQFKISGISVDGSWRVEYEQQPKGNQLAPPYSSPTLREIVKIVNYQSNNLFADGLLRLVAQKGGSGFHLFDQGVSRELALWDSKGLSKGGMLIFDGSGLSPMNRVTTDYLSRMLALSMKEQQIAESFYNSLPIAGKEGTVKSLFSDGSMGNRLRLKSGSMGGVLSYAGFLDKGGKRYAIAIIVNHFDASHSVVRSRIEKWIRVFEAGL